MSNKQDRDAEKNQAAAPISTTEREKTIVRTSILGIVANVLLAAFKAVVGVISNSIAITLDAVNNLSDALSSVITIVGTKLAGRAPDKRHPMGYGRIEYLTAMVISIIVLYAGITSAVESVQKIVSPEAPDYSAAALVVVAAGVVAKVLLGRHVQSVGRRVNADSLVASGQDALSDAVLSVSTLGAAVVYLAWGISLEAWVGAVISAFIVKAGLEMLWQTLSQILGERVSPELAEKVKSIVAEDECVLGVYDLFLSSYGPERRVGSVHVEVPDTTRLTSSRAAWQSASFHARTARSFSPPWASTREIPARTLPTCASACAALWLPTTTCCSSTASTWTRRATCWSST